MQAHLGEVGDAAGVAPQASLVGKRHAPASLGRGETPERPPVIWLCDICCRRGFATTPNEFQLAVDWVLARSAAAVANADRAARNLCSKLNARYNALAGSASSDDDPSLGRSLVWGLFIQLIRSDKQPDLSVFFQVRYLRGGSRVTFNGMPRNAPPASLIPTAGTSPVRREHPSTLNATHQPLAATWRRWWADIKPHIHVQRIRTQLRIAVKCHDET
jgi:hypothetical protein